MQVHIFAGIPRPSFLDVWVPFALKKGIQWKKKQTGVQKLRQEIVQTENRRIKLPNYGLIRLL